MDTVRERFADDKARLDALLEFANNATGESDANIGDAIKTLCDGFGQGGSGGNLAKATGELTLSNEAYGVTFWHNLGKVPLSMRVWLEEDDPSTFVYAVNRCVEAIWERDGNSMLIGSGQAKKYNAAINIQPATVVDDSFASGGGCYVSENKMLVNGTYRLYAAKYKWEAIYEVDGGVQLPWKVTEVPVETNTRILTIPVEPHDFYVIAFTSEADLPTSGYICYAGGGCVRKDTSGYSAYLKRRQGDSVNLENVKFAHSTESNTISITSGVYFTTELSPYIVGVYGIDL